MFQWYDGRHCVEKFWDMLLQLCIMHVINLAKLQSDCELKKKPQAEFFQSIDLKFYKTLQNVIKCMCIENEMKYWKGIRVHLNILARGYIKWSWDTIYVQKTIWY